MSWLSRFIYGNFQDRQREVAKNGEETCRLASWQKILPRRESGESHFGVVERLVFRMFSKCAWKAPDSTARTTAGWWW